MIQILPLAQIQLSVQDNLPNYWLPAAPLMYGHPR